MLQNKFTHLIDGTDAVEITLVLGLAPSEQAVTAEDQAVAAWIILHGLFDQECEFESGTLPRNPRDVAAEFSIELFQLALAVGAGGERDGPVRVEMVHMRKRKERVQGSID